MTEILDKTCAFCALPRHRVVNENITAIAIRDGYPVTPGYTSLIPKRHASSFFDMSPQERCDIIDFLDRMKTALEKEFMPQGYNIGINDGPAAGQPVSHLRVNVIPRYTGDISDPRGGVRWVISDKAKYWI
jgi:diadenosine tetraphosphate (Ap4A) HIT family hydrolase